MYGRESLSANQFYEELAKSEWGWVKGIIAFGQSPKQSEIECVMRLVEKYREKILDLKEDEINKTMSSS